MIGGYSSGHLFSDKLSSMTSKGIEMVETIKSNGAESSYFDTWSEAQDNVYNQSR